MDNDLSRRHFLKLGAAGVAGASLASWESQAADFHLPQGKMSTRVLGKTGVTVSILGLGGQSAVTDFPNDELAAKFINHCIDAGINYLDTAPLYGQANDPRNSERRYGKALAHRRGDVYLATKTLETPGRRGDARHRNQLEVAANRSFRLSANPLPRPERRPRPASASPTAFIPCCGSSATRR